MTTAPPTPPAFSPQDLVNAILFIDEGVNQGAYKGWETIERAKVVRTRLLMFAEHWQKTIEAEQAQNAPAEAPATEGAE